MRRTSKKWQALIQKRMQSGGIIETPMFTEMIPDIDYEVRLFLANRGWDGVWDEICDEA